jgi:hypothetical protein
LLTQTVPATASISPLLERKIEETSAGLQAAFARHLSSISEDDAITIIDYIAAMKSEVNLSDNYRRDIIEILCRFSRFNSNKHFKGLKRADTIAFLETFRRTETQDPMHKWIGTYNLFRIHLVRFFKWLYYPDFEPARGFVKIKWLVS